MARVRVIAAGCRRATGARRYILALAGVAAIAAGALTPGVASGTTGPGYLMSKPKYSFPNSALKSYSARYYADSIAKSSKIISAQLFIGLAESGYAAGGISIYSYDAQGQEQSFAGALYNFRLVKGTVVCDIVTAGNQSVLGELTFKHVGSSRDMVGTIVPPGGGGPYTISWRYGHPAGVQGTLPTPGPPNPGVVSGKALTDTTAAPVAPQSSPGWGAAAEVLGAYHVLTSGTTTSSASAGIFALALTVAKQLSTAKAAPNESLRLVVFKSSGGLAQGGIFKINTPSGSETVYLNSLKRVGTEFDAAIAKDSLSGSPIGVLSATRAGAGSLAATFTIPGVLTGTQYVRFVRYATG
jgi:hypothetical protein